MGKHVFTLDKEKSRYLITSSGVRIHYKKHKGKTDWVVFVHGAGSNHSTWKPYLTDEISWIAFDIRGHGRSSRANITLEIILQDIKEIIHRETKGKVMLIGNSFGTLLAEKYYYAYPQEVKKLILISPYSSNFSYFSFGIHYLSRLLYHLFRGKTSKRRLQFTDYWKYHKKPIWYYPYFDIRGTSVSNIFNALSILFGNAINLKDLRIPTLVLVGNHDFYCKKREILREAEQNKKISLKFIDSHHLLITRAPEEVKRYINEAVR